MTTLHRSTHLCGDVDTRTLLGVEAGPDSDILITNKSIISRFHIASRKHVYSWTSKSWEPYTCSAIYDKNNSDVFCVIDYNILCSFSLDKDESNRHKFSTSIFKLINHEDQIFVVYQNGYIDEKLTCAVESRKATKKDLFSLNETIIQAQISHLETGRNGVILTKTKNKESTLYIVDLHSNNCLTKIQIKRSGSVLLNDSCITQNGDLITVWSDGDIYMTSIADDNLSSLPGKRIHSLHLISHSLPARLVYLSKNHIAVVGKELSDEGGCLILLDTKFGVVNSFQKLKLYRNPPLAFNTPGGIVIVEAGALALVTYVLCDSSISNMFASKTVTKLSIDKREQTVSDTCCSWPISMENSTKETSIPGEALKTAYSYTSTPLCEVMNNLLLGSLSQNFSSSEVITYLVSEKKEQLLNEALKTFKNISESSIVTALNYFLRLEECNSKMDIEENELKCPFSEKNARYINVILAKSFTAGSLLKHIRDIKFAHALVLMQYLHYLIETMQCFIANDYETPSLENISIWFNLLLDVNYTQLAMSSELDVEEMLLRSLGTMTCIENTIEEIVDIQHLIKTINQGLKLPSSQVSAPYSLERLIIDL